MIEKKTQNDSKSKCPNCERKPGVDNSRPSTDKKYNSCGRIGHFAAKRLSNLSNNKTGSRKFNKSVSQHADGGQFSEGERFLHTIGTNSNKLCNRTKILGSSDAISYQPSFRYIGSQGHCRQSKDTRPRLN